MDENKWQAADDKKKKDSGFSKGNQRSIFLLQECQIKRAKGKLKKKKR